MKAIILVLFFGLASSQAQICSKIILKLYWHANYAYFVVSPQQWEGLIFEFYGVDESSAPTAIRFGKESYDASELRRRFTEELDSSRTDREYYDELFLHKEVDRMARPAARSKLKHLWVYFLYWQGIGYRLNVRTRECEKFPLTEPWRPVEVPANTTLEATYYLGSENVPGNYVRMNAYHGNTERGVSN